MPDEPMQAVAASPAPPANGSAPSEDIPPSLENAIFKRFWIWLGSLSALILALGGIVWALSVAELKEYAKNVSENKAHEEWSKINTTVADEMRRIREELGRTTEAANKAVGDSRERVGEANEISKTARKIASDVEGELKQLEASIKTAGQIFAAKTELETAVNSVVKTPEFQAQFGAKIDAVGARSDALGAKIDALQKRVDVVDGITKSLGGGRILAIAEVRDKSIVYGSPGVTFIGDVLTFPNPKNLKYAPVLTTTSTIGYITSAHFINGSVTGNQFRISQHAMDTGGTDRTSAAGSFTVIVIGFDPSGP